MKIDTFCLPCHKFPIHFEIFLCCCCATLDAENQVKSLCILKYLCNILCIWWSFFVINFYGTISGMVALKIVGRIKVDFLADLFRFIPQKTDGKQEFSQAIVGF